MQSIIYIEPSDEKLDPIVKQIAVKLKSMPEGVRGSVKGLTLDTGMAARDAELSAILDELIVAQVADGAMYNTETIAKVLANVAATEGPTLLFFGFTHQGMELAPAVALKTGVPVITGCIDFGLDDHRATVRRLIHAAKVSVAFEVSIDKGAVFSVQKGSLKDIDPDGPAASSAAAFRIRALPWKEEWAPEKTEIVELMQESVGEGEDITKARILVSVGRGLGSPDGLPTARELAGLVGGMVSCSRPVVDLGWLPSLHQVGLSGKSVSPVIYLALGISGQGNHVVGMETSKIIIAVNKDAQAPIFQIAHYGIIDDIQQFVPQLIEHIKR